MAVIADQLQNFDNSNSSEFVPIPSEARMRQHKLT